MADLVTIVETVAITQFLTPGAKSLGEVALEQAQRMSRAAVQLLTNVGRTPQPVEPKVLVPLVQAAALETDEDLAAKWAALLANAADPTQQAPVQPAFAEVLRQLTLDDAHVLSYIYEMCEDGDEPIDEADGMSKIIDVFAHFEWPSQRVELSLDNLLRLRLFETRTGDMYGAVPALTSNAPIAPTIFGRKFLLACTPPTA